MQHDLYSWQVLGDKFVEAEISNSSELIDRTITNWLAEVSPKQREDFFEILYEILRATKAETLPELTNNWFSSAKAMIKTYKNLDTESKKVMIKTITALFKMRK